MVALIDEHGRNEVLLATRAVLAGLRIPDQHGSRPLVPPLDEVLGEIAIRVRDRARPMLRPLINMTGTVLHTNLGRAIMPQEALDAMRVAAAEPVNLEYSLSAGQRGDRDSIVESLLMELTGAEAATVVNNNAAAVLLSLGALAGRKQAILSRGEMVEIGGAFRIPDIMRRAQVRLIEVGTTNRTRISDYEQALTPKTSLILRVHTSNYKIVGFAESAPLEELCALSARVGVPVMEDLGSGALVDFSRWGLPPEPVVAGSIARGVAVVTFSGDKLLGGPQAGIVVGRRSLIDRIKRDPLKRALRVDKVTLAGLEAVLRLYRDPDRLVHRLPTLRWLTRSADSIGRVAAVIGEELRLRLPAEQWSVEVRSCASMIGAGSQPIERLASVGVVLTPSGPGKGRRLLGLEAAFRGLPIPLIGRLHADALWLDCRMVDDPAAVVRALGVWSGKTQQP